MKLPIYQIDSFTNKTLSGNPSAIIILPHWLEDDLLQQIAEENNLGITAFLVEENADYHIRWFTPIIEIQLCGHATLAAAYVLLFLRQVQAETLTFHSSSGPLKVSQQAEILVLDLPIDQYQLAIAPPALTEALSPIVPLEVYKGKTDYLVILETEKEVRELALNIGLLATIPARGIIFSAKGNEVDFVSRFFAPQININEDAVTGSAHSTLAPYWSNKLTKTRLVAKQLSARGGHLVCEIRNDRVLISAQCCLYLKGQIQIDA
jgi:PhzF family phenazine biosynthesis protein